MTSKITPPLQPVIRKLANDLGERALGLNRRLAAGDISPLGALREVQALESDMARLGRTMRAFYDAV
jgi:hypothetical protein